MKRLSSFGFTLLSQAQSSQEPVEKRARLSQSVSDPSESSGDQPQPEFIYICRRGFQNSPRAMRTDINLNPPQCPHIRYAPDYHSWPLQ